MLFKSSSFEEMLVPSTVLDPLHCQSWGPAGAGASEASSSGQIACSSSGRSGAWASNTRQPSDGQGPACKGEAAPLCPCAWCLPPPPSWPPSRPLRCFRLCGASAPAMKPRCRRLAPKATARRASAADKAAEGRGRRSQQEGP